MSLGSTYPVTGQPLELSKKWDLQKYGVEDSDNYSVECASASSCEFVREGKG